MGYLRIRCGNCGNHWDVYAHGDYYREDARTCPHCLNEIDKQTWKQSVVPAFGAMCDANRQLLTDSTGYGITLFSVEYREPAREPTDRQYRESRNDELTQTAAFIDLVTNNGSNG